MLRWHGWCRKELRVLVARRCTCSRTRFWRCMRLRARWRRSVRALALWTLETWVTLARAPACAADPRVTRVGMLLLVITGAADSDILLTLPARLVVLSSTAGRGPGETYTDMLGCSMRRSSMGLASAEAPSCRLTRSHPSSSASVTQGFGPFRSGVTSSSLPKNKPVSRWNMAASEVKGHVFLFPEG